MIVVFKNKKAKNSHSNISKKQDEKKKQATKLKTEWTEFCKIITNKELKKSPDEKIINNIFNGVNEKRKSNINYVVKEGFEPTTFGL